MQDWCDSEIAGREEGRKPFLFPTAQWGLQVGAGAGSLLEVGTYLGMTKPM